MIDQETVIDLLKKLGAPQDKAKEAAEQLNKRAIQLAIEREIEPDAAMEYLLKRILGGQLGDESAASPSNGGEKDL